MTEQELMERYLDGDATAFDQFYARHKDAFYTYLRNRAPTEADDLFQGAWIKFIDAVRRRDIASPRAYLYRIGLNLIRNLSRQRPTVALDSIDEPMDTNASQPDPERPLREAEARAVLAKLARDKPDFYDVLHLHLFEEMTFDDISELLERNRNTVSAQYRYAMQYLRRNREMVTHA